MNAHFLPKFIEYNLDASRWNNTFAASSIKAWRFATATLRKAYSGLEFVNADFNVHVHAAIVRRKSAGCDARYGIT